ncbi:MAG: protein kinase [Acidobacteria bacterium]|nr:protein kinase [Acidobacteriota bacterium]MCW5967527.1 protein kinase [Blastocatellales bacterium]
MLQADTVLQGRYRIVRLIGQGGMGAVYEARDLRLGDSTVALKQALFNSDQLKRAFEREAVLLASLSHPNLPKVRDQFAEAAGQFLVMEYISGPDLSKLLSDSGGILPVAQVAGFADQLLDALEYIHEHEPPVIHRDIKPENIKLTARGQVMLIDFGLAKDLGGVSVIAYSAAYAPLEQLRAKGTDARSDIYALGATLYRLVTGRAPINAVERLEALANTGRDPLRAPHDLSLAIPERFSRALEKAMELDRDNRFQNAREMRKALRDALSGAPEKPVAAPMSGLPTIIDQRPDAPQRTAPPPVPQRTTPPAEPSRIPSMPVPPARPGAYQPTPPPQWNAPAGQYYTQPPAAGASVKKKGWGLIIVAIIVGFFMLSCVFLSFLGILIGEE